MDWIKVKPLTDPKPIFYTKDEVLGVLEDLDQRIVKISIAVTEPQPTTVEKRKETTMNLENTSLERLRVVMEGVAQSVCDLMVDEPDNQRVIDHCLAVYREYRDEYTRRMEKHFQECEEWQAKRAMRARRG